MNAARKIIGALVLFLIAIPVLVAVIWAVGVTKAAVSPEFISDFPREVIAEIPDDLEAIVKEAKDPANISDENTRAWFEAVSKAGISPKEILDRTGLSDWMEQELAGALREVGEILRGQREPKPVMIDLRPLKEALDSDLWDVYLAEVLRNLPPCDEQGINRWMELRDFGYRDIKIPACRPDMDVAGVVLKNERMKAIEKMPNDIQLFEDVQFMPFGVSKTVVWLSYLLFLLPLLFVFLGALIAGTSASGFFRWFGASIFVGGSISFVLSFFAGHITQWAIHSAQFSHAEEWSSELGVLVLSKVQWIPTMIVDKLFSPVTLIGGIVCLVGIFFFFLSVPFRKTS